MPDLTILYITASQMPARWVAFQLTHLRRAAGDYPIISVSRQPMDLGINLIDDGVKGYWNIYMQMLRAVKIATTPYVAMAEDDVLYTREHFASFRPPTTSVAYDRSRWSLFAWDPIYCLRQRISNCSLIAPRELLIEAMAERAAKYPNGNDYVGEVGRRKVERTLGVAVRPSVEWYSRGPIVQLNHVTGTDRGRSIRSADGRHMIKPHGQIQAIEIPYWGKAVDIVKHYDSN